MVDRSKKYKQKGSILQPHAGEMLKQYKQSNKLNGAALAREIGVAGNAVGDYCRRESLQIGILWKISLVLKHNFFQAFADALPFGPESVKETELKGQLAEKDKIIDDLEKELAVYKRIVGK